MFSLHDMSSVPRRLCLTFRRPVLVITYCRPVRQRFGVTRWTRQNMSCEWRKQSLIARLKSPDCCWKGLAVHTSTTSAVCMSLQKPRLHTMPNAISTWWTCRNSWAG
ncbi:hypothetical protein AB205_0080400, partial [Aquarana catesbeiana]